MEIPTLILAMISVLLLGGTALATLYGGASKAYVGSDTAWDEIILINTLKTESSLSFSILYIYGGYRRVKVEDYEYVASGYYPVRNQPIAAITVVCKNSDTEAAYNDDIDKDLQNAHFTVKGLEPSQEYNVDVTGVTFDFVYFEDEENSFEMATNNIYDDKLLKICTNPASVTDLVVESSTTTSIKVTWTEPATVPENYKVFIDDKAHGTIATGTTEYEFTELVQGSATPLTPGEFHLCKIVSVKASAPCAGETVATIPCGTTADDNGDDNGNDNGLGDDEEPEQQKCECSGAGWVSKKGITLPLLLLIASIHWYK